MIDIVNWLNQPVSIWWTIGLLITLPLSTLAGLAIGVRRADRRDQKRHDEWVRRFKAGEAQ